MPRQFFTQLRHVFQLVNANRGMYLSNVRASNAEILEAIAHASGLAPPPHHPARPTAVCLFSGRNARAAFEWASEQGLLTDGPAPQRALLLPEQRPSSYAQAASVLPAAAAADPVLPAAAVTSAVLPSDFEHDRQCKMTCSNPECLLVHVPGTICAREEAGERCKIFHRGNRNHGQHGCPFGHECQGPYLLPYGRVAVGFQNWMFTGTNKHKIQYKGGLTLAGRNARK